MGDARLPRTRLSGARPTDCQGPAPPRGLRPAPPTPDTRAVDATSLAPVPIAARLPLVGSMLHYFRSPLGFLEDTARRGDLVEMDFVGRRAWLLNDPALVEQAFVKTAANLQKDVFLRELKRVLGEGLLTSEGELWKRQRRLIQPAFHRERIAGYGAGMVLHAARMLEGWRDGETIDLHQAMMALTSDIVTHALFGAEAGDTREVSRCIEAIMERFADPLYLLVPAMSRLPTAANRRVNEVSERLDAVVRGFISRRRAMGGAGPDDDLLAMLLAAQDEDGARMTDRQVRDEVLILFLAGHETTALNLSWTFHLLSQHPLVEAALHAELDAALGGRDPTFDDLPKLKLAERVVQESLRLYPPAWSLGREAIAPFELGGRSFDQGAWIWVIPWTMHRDPRFFPEPLAFRPERWEDGLAKRLPRGAYIPFGAGPRVCIGNQFAMMEAVLVLATIAQRFSLRTAPSPAVVPEPSITLRFKHGIRATLARRGRPAR